MVTAAQLKDPPPPSVWRVMKGGKAYDIPAIWCSSASNNSVIFWDANGNIVRIVRDCDELWMVGSPYGGMKQVE